MISSWCLFGSDTGNYPAAVTTVDAEVSVGCQDDTIGQSFRHSHEASIG
jgi:hypothetical protein